MLLSKAEDYCEPRIGPEYQAALLPEPLLLRPQAPAWTAKPKQRGAWGEHTLLYSSSQAKQVEEKNAFGPQRDVLLDEVRARVPAAFCCLLLGRGPSAVGATLKRVYYGWDACFCVAIKQTSSTSLFYSVVFVTLHYACV